MHTSVGEMEVEKNHPCHHLCCCYYYYNYGYAGRHHTVLLAFVTIQQYNQFCYRAAECAGPDVVRSGRRRREGAAGTALMNGFVLILVRARSQFRIARKSYPQHNPPTSYPRLHHLFLLPPAQYCQFVSYAFDFASSFHIVLLRGYVLLKMPCLCFMFFFRWFDKTLSRLP